MSLFNNSEAKVMAFIIALCTLAYKVLALITNFDTIFEKFPGSFLLYLVLYSTNVLTIWSCVSNNDDTSITLSQILKKFLIFFLICDALYFLASCGYSNTTMAQMGIHPFVNIGLIIANSGILKEYREKAEKEAYLIQQQMLNNNPFMHPPIPNDGFEYGNTEADKAYDAKYNNKKVFGGSYK